MKSSHVGFSSRLKQSNETVDVVESMSVQQVNNDIRSMTVFATAKAGMSEASVEKISKVVYDISKDSPHFHNLQRKDAQVENKIRELEDKLRAIRQQWKMQPPHIVSALERNLQIKLNALTEEDSTGKKVFIHIDLDYFYAQVEC